MNASRTAVVLPLLLAACGSLSLKPDGCPDAFVPVDRGDFEWRVMSAKGVMIAMRTFPNEPESSLEFWAQVVEKDLQDGRGYVLEDAAPVQAAGANGRTMIFARDATSYLIAVFVSGRRIVVVEAGGPREEFQAELPGIRDWLSRMKIA